jgi:hypothetical protein
VFDVLNCGRIFRSGSKDWMIRHKTPTAGRKKVFEVWAAQRRA